MLRGSIRSILATLALAGVVAGGFLAWTQFQRRALDERVAALIEGLRGIEPSADAEFADRLRAAIDELADRPDLKSERRLFQGALALREDSPSAALERLEGVRPQGRLRGPLFRLVGESLYRTGRLREAETVFRRLADESAGEWEARFWLAKIYHDYGTMLAALKELEEYARQRPDDYLPHRLMGLIYHEDLHRPDEATASYRAALARDPPASQLADIRRELARCLAAREDYAGALEVLREVPPGPADLALTAECRWATGEIDGVQPALDEVARQDPQHPTVLVIGAVLAIERGDPQAAVPLLQRRLEQDPHDTRARYQLSRAYRNLGDEAASEAEAARFRETEALRERMDELHTQAIRRPGDYQVREELAEVCASLGQPALADKYRQMAAQIRQAVEPSPPGRSR